MRYTCLSKNNATIYDGETRTSPIRTLYAKINQAKNTIDPIVYRLCLVGSLCTYKN